MLCLDMGREDLARTDHELDKIMIQERKCLRAESGIG